jgi:hypothetical protein
LNTETLVSYEYHLQHANQTSILDLGFVSLASLAFIWYGLSIIVHHPWLAAKYESSLLDGACWISTPLPLG